MPEHDDVVSWDGLDPLDHQLSHLLEVPRKQKGQLVGNLRPFWSELLALVVGFELKRTLAACLDQWVAKPGTYDLLIFTFRGLMSARLKTAKKSSQGAQL